MGGIPDKKNTILSALRQFRAATGGLATLVLNSVTSSDRDDFVYIQLADTRYRVATVSHLSHANFGILMLGVGGNDEHWIVITE